jgi:hypothetical protein
MVDDIDVIHDMWQAEGVPVTDIVMESPHRVFELTDPDGHVVVVRRSILFAPSLVRRPGSSSPTSSNVGYGGYSRRAPPRSAGTRRRASHDAGTEPRPGSPNRHEWPARLFRRQGSRCGRR